jgi:AcrR family transcriptional regulator
VASTRRRHDEHELLGAAVDAALQGGLADLTFGRLAKRIGTSDRMLVYYFGDKDQLVERVIGALAMRLLERLGEAFGEAQRSPTQLLRKAWPLLTDEESTPAFALWFEMAGRAAAGHEPERRLATAIASTMVDWLADRIDAPTASARAQQAALLTAVLDGALLLHHLGLPDAAATAVRRFTT